MYVTNDEIIAAKGINILMNVLEIINHLYSRQPAASATLAAGWRVNRSLV